MSHPKLKNAAQVSKQLLDAATSAVKNDGMSENSAAKAFGVSRTTLRSRLRQPVPNSVGGRLKLPEWEEEALADFLLSCSDMGIPFNRHHFQQLFEELADELSTYTQK